MREVGLKYKGTSEKERDTYGRLPFEMLDRQKNRDMFCCFCSANTSAGKELRSRKLGNWILIHSFPDSPYSNWILSPTSRFTLHLTAPPPAFSPQSHPSYTHTAKSKTVNEESHSFSPRVCAHRHTHTHTQGDRPHIVFQKPQWFAGTLPERIRCCLSHARADV